VGGGANLNMFPKLVTKKPKFKVVIYHSAKNHIIFLNMLKFSRKAFFLFFLVFLFVLMKMKNLLEGLFKKSFFFVFSSFSVCINENEESFRGITREYFMC
jgi:hypothetical protein